MSEHAFGSYIASARQSAGLSQRELAYLVDPGMESNQISRWERGKNLPTAARVVALIDSLSLDPGRAWTLWGEAQAGD